jgi:5'-nucleotidase
MLILCDMDGVLTDFEGSFYRTWSEKYPDRPLIPYEKRTHFYISNEHREWTDDINAIVKEEGFFLNLSEIPEAINGLLRLQWAGHSVKICTSPVNNSNYCIQEKLQWVRNHLGRTFEKDLITTSDKTVIYGDFLIDDKPYITGYRKIPSWSQIMFDAPYNRHVKSRFRVGSWLEMSNII